MIHDKPLMLKKPKVSLGLRLGAAAGLSLIGAVAGSSLTYSTQEYAAMVSVCEDAKRLPYARSLGREQFCLTKKAEFTNQKYRFGAAGFALGILIGCIGAGYSQRQVALVQQYDKDQKDHIERIKISCDVNFQNYEEQRKLAKSWETAARDLESQLEQVRTARNNRHIPDKSRLRSNTHLSIVQGENNDDN